MEENVHRVLRFDCFALDLTRGCLRRDDQDIDLRPKAFDVLRHLAENAGRLVSKQELDEAVWPNVLVGDNSLVQCIRELREKLGDDTHCLIKTVPRRGYLLDVPVSIGGVTSVQQRQPTAASTEKSLAPLLPERPSIAVLPFANLSGDPGQEYFADGIVEDIITELSRFGELFVIARNSSFQYKGKATDVREIGCTLGARYVLEGSVRREEGRIRISAQLIDAANGGHLWANKYDHHCGDIFALQDEITQSIVGAVRPEILEGGRAAHKRPANLGAFVCSMEAYDYFLRGRDQRLQFTIQSITHAEVALKRAIKLDPAFGPAYAVLADCYLVRYINGWDDNADHFLDEACELATTGVTLNPEYARSHCYLGNAFLWKGQHNNAITSIEKALALAPNFSYAYMWLGWVLHYAGRFEEAIVQMNTGMRLDPLHHSSYLHWLAQPYFHLRCYNQAVELLERRLIRRPDTDISRVLLASAFGHLGRASEARTQWWEALRINPKYSLEQRRRVSPYKNSADFDHVIDGLRKADLPE